MPTPSPTQQSPNMRAPDATRRARAALAAAVVVCGALAALPRPASAQQIENPIAVFAALDKVTGRISQLEIPIDEVVQFGSLKVAPRVCYTRAPTKPPKTTGFIEVTEVELEGDEKRIFSGWMFAESPGLNAVEHPVFDVWLTGCRGGSQLASGEIATSGSEVQRTERRRRRRVRR